MGLLLCLAVCGCRDARNGKSGDEAAVAPLQERTSGSFTLRVFLRPPSPSLINTVTLAVEAEYPEDAAVEFPNFAEAFKGNDAFAFGGFQEGQPKLTANGTLLRAATISLDPQIAPKHVIPSMSIRFTAPAHNEATVLETDAIVIPISLPDNDFWNSLDIRDGESMNPLDALAPPSRRWPWVLGACALLATTATIIWRNVLRHRHTVAPPPPPPPAHEIALLALQRLDDDDLITKGRFEEYHNRISAILREYLENRFNLHAPERTTEEFLQELRNAPCLREPEQQRLLKSFLTQCDLVKFAKHTPTIDDARALHDSCESFIRSTAQREPSQP